ncbi:DUF5316 domain-containing protein [Paenibacillus antibioticophila]|uniref:DUF5316 domain-containing protein n=1 Tax=Paenibacillus antibioticophila TaxID=1274374 RepID=UPI000677DFE8|nr:DUF5316 domain-containing protein [Paenibacillus antibioticophila]
MRTLLLGTVIGFVLAMAIGIIWSWEAAMKLVGSVGIIAWLSAGVLSGAFISGDRSRANQNSETEEDRKWRVRASTRLFGFGLPSIAASILIYIITN